LINSFDSAPEAFDLSLETLVIGSEGRSYIFGVEIVGAGGEAHQVDEQHRHDLALLGPGRRRCLERRGALQTEFGLVRVLLATVRTNRHISRRLALETP
jgi:hypothetical protein